MSHQNFWFYKDSIEETVNECIKRRVLAYDQNMMIVEVSFEAGGIGALHKHVHEQTTYVLFGSFEFEIGGIKKVIQTGDSVYLEPYVLHGCVCLEKGKLLDIFTPHREDFIEKEYVK